MQQTDGPLQISDSLGKLQFTPFPTCNETSKPLSLQYGVSQTVTCTVDSVSDDFYHILEFYVHSDAPLSCRIPTVPLGTDIPPGDEKSEKKTKKKADDDDDDDDDKEKKKKKKQQKQQQQPVKAAADDDDAGEDPNGKAVERREHPYTPLTISTQGSLQMSHLHIWTDMNVILHSIGSTANKKGSSDSKKKGKIDPGFVVAGTAYSLPEYDGSGASFDNQQQQQQQQKATTGVDEYEIIKAARDPWTYGHGTKVTRGEPLTFTFHVFWVEGAGAIRWPSSSSSSSSSVSSPSKSDFVTTTTCSPSSSSSVFSSIVFFGLAAGIGAVAAVYWDRYRSVIVTTYNRGRRRDVGRREGILGVSSKSSSPGLAYGNGNGYGGYRGSRDFGAVANGIGGYGIGKRD